LRLWVIKIYLKKNNNKNENKTNKKKMTILFRSFDLLVPNLLLNYMDFQSNPMKAIPETRRAH